ncbi:MAG: phosphatase PAP2 family protein [Bacteroidota bacterium]
MATVTRSENNHFATGFIITLVAAICIVADSFVIGRNQFFLLLNGNLGSLADYFFRFWTFLGDGAVWVVVAVLFFIYQKKKFPLLVTAIIVSTLIVQVTKTYLFPAEPRPTVAISNIHSIHTVEGVELHTAYSFPSGHTTTAFTIYLLACLFVKKKWIIPMGFLYALLVGYSRIYLAQHFPLDVGGGMFAALITVPLSIAIQKRWEKRNG